MPVPRRSKRPTTILAVLAALPVCLALALPAGAGASSSTVNSAAANSAVAKPPDAGGPPAASPVARGVGGAAASVDPYATQAAIDVLASGGNATDAAVAAAAVLNLVEPYSGGIGGGGFMVVYDAATGEVETIDHRETAPLAIGPDTFGSLPFEQRVTSGLGVGVPGLVAGWEMALERHGSRGLGELLRPAITLAERGFLADPTYERLTQLNADRFADITSTRELFLTGAGTAPAAGTRIRNHYLARTLRLIAEQGARIFYEGEIAEAIVAAVTDPPVRPGASRPVWPGRMTTADLAAYQAVVRAPTVSTYRGLTIYGMAPPSSGGSTVGETLNILEGLDLAGLPREQSLHYSLEASRLAFADRGAFIGDPDFVDVPLDALLSKDFAATRRCLMTPRAAASPVPPGDPDAAAPDAICAPARTSGRAPGSLGGGSTTHLTVADRHGNVVSYTFTLEQIGGSGIAVPGYGFLLNNELTDFSDPPAANQPGPGKRPRSSMSPTIVLAGDQPVLALGAAGGASIITTVGKILLNVVDFGAPLPDAIAAPRASQRDTPVTSAEPAFLATPDAAELIARGHTLEDVGEIAVATGIAIHPTGELLAAAEPTRRGGGSAMVVTPDAPTPDVVTPDVVTPDVVTPDVVTPDG